MRVLRIITLVLGASLVLASSALGYTPAQINQAVAQRLVGSSFTGGPNVQVFVHGNLPRREAQLVINDCSTGPTVGKWLFFQKKIKVLTCGQQTLLAPHIPKPRDYHKLGLRAIQRACTMIRSTANYHQPKGRWQHMRIPCGNISAYNGMQARNPAIPYPAIAHVELIYTCPGHVHDSLSRVVLTSDGRLVKFWCDGSTLTYWNRNL